MRILVLQERTEPYFIRNWICHFPFLSSAVYLSSVTATSFWRILTAPSLQTFNGRSKFMLNDSHGPSVVSSWNAISACSHPLLWVSTRVLGCLQSCHHLPNLQAIAQTCLFITFLMSHHSFIKPWNQFTSQWHILQLQETKLMDTFFLIPGQRLGVNPCCSFCHTAWLCLSPISPQYLSSPLETGVKYSCWYPQCLGYPAFRTRSTLNAVSSEHEFSKGYWNAQFHFSLAETF